MKEKDLQIDRNVHVVYSKKCRNIIKKRISNNYGPEKTEEMFEKVQHQYERYLADFERRDLGGAKNFHNGAGGTYDCFLILSYYVACREKTSFKEIEDIERELIVGPFGKLKFFNIEKPVFKRLMYKAFKGAEKKCSKWHDYEMQVDEYSKDKPLHYCFTRCPYADFVRQFGLEEIAGALCNVDYDSMEAMNVKLVRRHTCIESDQCDYTFYSPNDPYVKEHPEYIDERGFIRNK